MACFIHRADGQPRTSRAAQDTRPLDGYRARCNRNVKHVDKVENTAPWQYRYGGTSSIHPRAEICPPPGIHSERLAAVARVQVFTVFLPGFKCITSVSSFSQTRQRAHELSFRKHEGTIVHVPRSPEECGFSACCEPFYLSPAQQSGRSHPRWRFGARLHVNSPTCQTRFTVQVISMHLHVAGSGKRHLGS